jgi:hypothetical protein
VDNRFWAHRSRKLDELLASPALADARVKITDDTGSSWVGVEVFGKYGWVGFAIWKATDALYALDGNGAAGDDPIAIRTAVKNTELIPKHRTV